MWRLRFSNRGSRRAQGVKEASPKRISAGRSRVGGRGSGCSIRQKGCWGMPGIIKITVAVHSDHVYIVSVGGERDRRLCQAEYAVSLVPR